ncbi:hypothetical protein ACVSQB_10245 [Bradyrhizobium elkanii]
MANQITRLVMPMQLCVTSSLPLATSPASARSSRSARRKRRLQEQKCGVVTGVDDNESGDGRAQAAIWGCKPIFAGSLRISTRPRRFPRR